MKQVVVPLMIAVSGSFMACAWLAHLKYRDSIGFWSALAMSWCLVLPEYVLNVAAARDGYGTFSGAQISAMHLAAGAFFMALVSKAFLKEPVGPLQLLGLAMVAAGAALVLRRA